MITNSVSLIGSQGEEEEEGAEPKSNPPTVSELCRLVAGQLSIFLSSKTPSLDLETGVIAIVLAWTAHSATVYLTNNSIGKWFSAKTTSLHTRVKWRAEKS